MQHFMSKISAKNVFIIIKTCSAFVLGGFHPPDPLTTPPAFQFPPDRRGLEETLEA